MPLRPNVRPAPWPAPMEQAPVSIRAVPSSTPAGDPAPGDAAAAAAWLARLHADLAQSLGGVLLRGALAVPVGAGGTNRPTTTAGRLVGWSLAETGGAQPVTVRLLDGSDAGGEIVAVAVVAAGTSQTITLPGGGVSITRGLYLDTTGTGTLTGAVWLGSVD